MHSKIFPACRDITGSLPGPIVFGSIIDSTCTLWHEEDGVRGQCWFHNRRDLALYMIIFCVSLKVLAFLLLMTAYRTYKPTDSKKEAVDT